MTATATRPVVTPAIADETSLELTVLVPLWKRTTHIERLTNNFFETAHESAVIPLVETRAHLLFIANADDEEVVDELERVIMSGEYPPRVFYLLVPPDRVSWPMKINDGYRRSFGKWLLCGADDIQFHDGWWGATASLRARDHVGVIGTNDLGNPRCIAGIHTTHPLVRRTYAKNFGTVTHRDRVVHEGYRHWYVDDELVTTAKIRQAWAPCTAAVVEHLHPYWEKGEWDEVYKAGEDAGQEDRVEWERRVPILQSMMSHPTANRAERRRAGRGRG